MRRASHTAEFMALFRALETARDPADRLFEDPLARGFLRPALRWAVALAGVPRVGDAVPRWIDRRWPGARSSGVARTRWIDDILRAELGRGCAQIVLLGAGFDSRAVRLPGIARARVFEVDHPGTLRKKRKRLVAQLGGAPDHVAYVAVDFEHRDLGPALREAGFVSDARAFVLWEGVTNYLTAAAVDKTLRAIAEVAAPGSRLAFTYVHRGLLDGSVDFGRTTRLSATLRRVGEPWTFGLDPAELADYLAQRGLRLQGDWGAADYRAGVWGESARRMTGYEFYRLALAEISRVQRR